eukprot:g36443.t1
MLSHLLPTPDFQLLLDLLPDSVMMVRVMGLEDAVQGPLVNFWNASCNSYTLLLMDVLISFSGEFCIGTDKFGFGFGGTGKKSHCKQFDSYGEEFTMHDTIGCYIDLDKGDVKFSKNGKDLGRAFDIPAHLKNQAFFAACVLKNAELKFNFGEEEFKFPPKDGFTALDKAIDGHVVKSPHT